MEPNLRWTGTPYLKLQTTDQSPNGTRCSCFSAVPLPCKEHDLASEEEVTAILQGLHVQGSSK